MTRLALLLSLSLCACAPVVADDVAPSQAAPAHSTVQAPNLVPRKTGRHSSPGAASWRIIPMSV